MLKLHLYIPVEYAGHMRWSFYGRPVHSSFTFYRGKKQSEEFLNFLQQKFNIKPLANSHHFKAPI